MNPPQVYMCSPSWTLLPPPSPYHPSGSSQCTSPKHPVSCIELGLATRFIYHIIRISMPFSQIIPPSPSPTESKRLFYTSVSLLLSRIQGGTPLQYSCLENPMDGGAWKAAVHGVAECQTWLSDFPFTFMHRRRKWQPTPVFLPGESQGRGSLVDCRLWGRTESDTTEAT